MKKYSVYVLRHPETKEIRYVGCTIRDVTKRLYDHVSSARAIRVKNRGLEEWILGILKCGLYPEIEVVATSGDRDTMYTQEIHYIAKLRRAKYRLFNISEGGQGSAPLYQRDTSKMKYKTKRVYRYNTDGTFSKSYTSVKQAAEENGCTPSAIVTTAKDKKYTRVCCGFYWRYERKDQITPNPPPWGSTGRKKTPEEIEKHRQKMKGRKRNPESVKKMIETNKTPVKQMDKEGNVIAVWDSQKSVREILGKKLYSSRFGNKHTQHGFYWDWN